MELHAGQDPNGTCCGGGHHTPRVRSKLYTRKAYGSSHLTVCFKGQGWDFQKEVFEALIIYNESQCRNSRHLLKHPILPRHLSPSSRPLSPSFFPLFPSSLPLFPSSHPLFPIWNLHRWHMMYQIREFRTYMYVHVCTKCTVTLVHTLAHTRMYLCVLRLNKNNDM